MLLKQYPSRLHSEGFLANYQGFEPIQKGSLSSSLFALFYSFRYLLPLATAT